MVVVGVDPVEQCPLPLLPLPSLLPPLLAGLLLRRVQQMLKTANGRHCCYYCIGGLTARSIQIGRSMFAKASAERLRRLKLVMVSWVQVSGLGQESGLLRSSYRVCRWKRHPGLGHLVILIIHGV